MLTPEMKELMRRQVELSIHLSEETSRFVSDPKNLEPVVAPLRDGSIDAGDFEAVSRKLLDIIKDFPAYNQLIDFVKINRGEFAKLYRAVGSANDADFEAFIVLTQHLATEIVTAKMFQQLVEMKVLVDRRA
jgi:hypothetical protein